MDPERIIPVARAVCIRLELFIHQYRAGLLTRLRGKVSASSVGDAVFLCSRSGRPLSEATLAKDFQRIA